MLFDFQVLEIKVLDDAEPELVEHFDVHLASVESSDGQAGSIPTRYGIPYAIVHTEIYQWHVL